jgi:histone H3/H4
MPKKSEMAKAPVRAIMKSVGAKMVANDAIDLMTEAAIQYVRDVSTDALKLVRHGKRTKVTGDDIKFALKMRDNKSTT